MGIWVVQPDDLDTTLSEHTNETEAERAAIARAVALDDATVVVRQQDPHPPSVRINVREAT